MLDTSIAIAIEMKLNSEGYQRRDSYSVLYFTELYFGLLRMIKTNK